MRQANAGRIGAFRRFSLCRLADTLLASLSTGSTSRLTKRPGRCFASAAEIPDPSAVAISRDDLGRTEPRRECVEPFSAVVVFTRSGSHGQAIHGATSQRQAVNRRLPQRHINAALIYLESPKAPRWGNLGREASSIGSDRANNGGRRNPYLRRHASTAAILRRSRRQPFLPAPGSPNLIYIGASKLRTSPGARVSR
jgi:hypothetical protein